MKLIANAVQHATGDITLVVQAASGTVRVEVHDEGAPIAWACDADNGLVRGALEDERGRGLFIVDAVADRWGIADRELPPGKSVWFELASALLQRRG